MTFRFSRSSLFVVALTSQCLLGCGAEDEPTGSSSLPQLVDAVHATGVVGVQAAALRDGVSDWASAGVARVEDDLALTRQSRFRIASTTKTFVAATTLQLVEQGELSLDDTVEQWLPGVVTGPLHDGGRITLRQLLQHTSGLANHVDDQVALLEGATSAAEVRALLERAWSADELIALALAHPPEFAPGEGWAYTDTGYVLIGQVLEAVTGETWQTRVERQLIAPLGLSDTLVPSVDLAIPGAAMHGYAQLPGDAAPSDVTALNPSSLGAAGALLSTPSDVAQFFAALLAGDVLGPAQLAQMQTTVAIEGEGGPGYGLGLAWVPSECEGGRWMHDGDTLGYHTRTGVSADGSRSVVIAISGDADFEEPAAALIDFVLCGGAP
jgi:D-alanyl-D-alanine carboxypeptidase